MGNDATKCHCGCSKHAGSDAVSENRRGFLSQAATVALGAAAIAVPTAVGATAFLNPLRQKSQGGDFLRLASLDALPSDGAPVKVPVVADRVDAWSRFPAEAIGAVFLRRTEKGVEALQVICPHAGCSINYDAPDKRFFCPCHAAAFDLNGKRLDATSPSPRDMDSLEVQVRNKNEIWVKFQTFGIGVTAKKALA
jgi:menaquinol-cytochrome c reductase iron-sulfur subunit